MKAEIPATPGRRSDAFGSYLTAEIPRTFVILGQTLLPLSLWHLELLLRLQNGFVVEEEPITDGDLIQGVFVCCQSWEEGAKALREDSSQKLQEWGEAIGAQLAKENPKRFLKKGIDLEKKALEFAEYLAEGSGRPELLPSDNIDSRVPGAPLLQLLKLFLIETLRCSESEAMNYSFAKACHHFFAHHEKHGQAKIANKEEGEALDEMNEVAESEDGLKACLEALPGAVPIREQDKAIVKEWKKAKPKRKRR